MSWPPRKGRPGVEAARRRPVEEKKRRQEGENAATPLREIAEHGREGKNNNNKKREGVRSGDKKAIGLRQLLSWRLELFLATTRFTSVTRHCRSQGVSGRRVSRRRWPKRLKAAGDGATSASR